MNTEQIKYLIDQISDLGVNALSFTGGEPTLRKDISELFNKDISKYILGAVQNDGLHYQDRLGIPKNYLFFNSGVLLINMKKSVSSVSIVIMPKDIYRL